MTPQPPPGQGPIDPRGAFSPPPPPGYPQQVPPVMPPVMPSGMPPGGFMPPPPMGFGPPPGWFPPPRKERSFGRALLTTFATTIFGISLMLNIYLLVLSGLMGDHAGKSDTIVEGDPKQVVAVVPIVNSLITAKDAESLDNLLKQVEKNENVKALVLRIDTPGGEVAPSDEMYHRILQYKTAHPGIPVVVSMGSLATSGGYYTACAADWLVAEPTTLTANIGVLEESINIAGLCNKWGIQDTTLHSTGADYKTSGSMFRPPTTQDVEYLTGILDSIADQFHDAVKTGRQGRIKAPLQEVFNAQAYTAQKALSMGLVDQIGYQQDACDYAAKKAGLTNMTVMKFEEPAGLLKLLQGKSSVAEPQASGGVKINGMTVDAPQLDQLLNPRPLYLWRPN
jgi:protease-4